jgi:hypothetical protein
LPDDTAAAILNDAVLANNRYDGRPASATEVLELLIRLLTLVEAKSKK